MRTFARLHPAVLGEGCILICGHWVLERDVLEAADQINHGVYIEHPMLAMWRGVRAGSDLPMPTFP